jgi:hypothetical protein
MLPSSFLALITITKGATAISAIAPKTSRPNTEVILQLYPDKLEEV